MTSPASFTLTQSRFIRAPRERVYDAFTTQAGIASWMGARGMTPRNAAMNPQLGGLWHVDMVARDGSTYSVGGKMVQMQRADFVAYTWRWEGDNSPMPNVETLVEVALADKDGGTQLDMRHSGFPMAPARDGHHQGWRSTLNRLSDYLDPSGSAGTVTLLGNPAASYTRTARMALAEKNVAYTLQVCKPHSPEVLALHPFGRIPAMRDGDIEIWETAAILNYIDECFDTGNSLRPGSITERTRAVQWISAVNSHLYDTMITRYLLQIVFPKGEGGQPDRRVIDMALKEMPAQLAALDKAYERSDYVAGSFSGADLFLAPILAGLQAMPEGGQLMATYPNLLRAQTAMQQRPSFINTRTA